MKTRYGFGLLAACGMLLGGTEARAERDFEFVIAAMPATVLIDADGDKFSVTDENGTRTSLSEVYTMPNIAMGVGLPVGNAQLDLLGGGGIIINDGFRSFMLQAIADVTWECANSLEIGPRLGLVYLPDPEWLENEDLNFDSDLGLLLGVHIAMGDKIQYLVSVDIIDFSLDTEDVQAGVEASEDSLDMSALAIQFGVRGEF